MLQTARAKKEAPPETATDKVLAEEADMMRHITQKQALRAAKELATDTVYTRSMSTGWKPPAEARECTVQSSYHAWPASARLLVTQQKKSSNFMAVLQPAILRCAAHRRLLPLQRWSVWRMCLAYPQLVQDSTYSHVPPHFVLQAAGVRGVVKAYVTSFTSA